MRLFLVFLTAAMMVMAAVEGGEVVHKPYMHRVGGQKENGWAPGVNYTEWSANEQPPFYVGDWLYFGFNKHMFNVLEVNKSSYENCNEHDFIKNITRGGRDVYNMTDARSYYFLSGGGYCWNGMKVAVTAHDFVPIPAPAAAPFANGATLGTSKMMVLPGLMLSIYLVLALLF